MNRINTRMYVIRVVTKLHAINLEVKQSTVLLEGMTLLKIVMNVVNLIFLEDLT